MHASSTTGASKTATSSNLAGGRIAPRWIYFLFYLYCRRQQEAPGAKWFQFRDPTFSAWLVLGYAFAGPWMVFLLLIDRFAPFLHPLGRLWVTWHLPGSPEHAWAYVWCFFGVLSGIGLLNLLFGRRYEKIMKEFAAYNQSSHTIFPLLISIPILVAMFIISGYGAVYRDTKSLLYSNLIVWVIFLITELIFRVWWHGWCRRHASA